MIAGYIMLYPIRIPLLVYIIHDPPIIIPLLGRWVIFVMFVASPGLIRHGRSEVSGNLRITNDQLVNINEPVFFQ